MVVCLESRHLLSPSRACPFSLSRRWPVGAEPFSGGFYKNPAQVPGKSQMVLESGNQGNMIISTGLPPEGRASPQEILSQQRWSPPPSTLGRILQNMGLQLFQIQFPWSLAQDLGDDGNNCRHSSSSDLSPQATPTQVSRHFRARHHLSDEKRQGGKGCQEGLGQKDHIISQASSQAGDCHFLLEPLDIERVHLMQKGKGRHIKMRDWLAPL